MAKKAKTIEVNKTEFWLALEKAGKAHKYDGIENGIGNVSHVCYWQDSTGLLIGQRIHDPDGVLLPEKGATQYLLESHFNRGK